MCLHAARLPERVNAAGDLNPFFEQDRSQWNQELVIEAQRLLDLAATGSELTEYHLEAAIAWAHATAHRQRKLKKSQSIREVYQRWQLRTGMDCEFSPK